MTIDWSGRRLTLLDELLESVDEDDERGGF
jgi:hypothetical protein